MNYSFEYIDIILLAMIAGFIFLRLRGILGKRTGFEGESAPQFKEVLIYEYDLYFSVFVLERYARIHSGRSSEFDLNSARKRYYSLFKDL